MSSPSSYIVEGDAKNFDTLVKLSQDFAKVSYVDKKDHVLIVVHAPAELEKKLKDAGGKIYPNSPFGLPFKN